MSSMPREALKTKAWKPGVMVVASSALNASARAMTSCGSEISAGVILFINPGYDFLRIGDIGRGDLVHHVGRQVAQHALGADIEDLNDALLVGGDTREVGAVENCGLQGPCLQQSLFRPLARGIIGADQQVADDGALIVAQRRD